MPGSSSFSNSKRRLSKVIRIFSLKSSGVSDSDASSSFHSSNSKSKSINPSASVTASNESAIAAAQQKKADVQDSLPASLVHSKHVRDIIAPFTREEIVFGPLLGSGEFANVYEISSFRIPNEESTTTINPDVKKASPKKDDATQDTQEQENDGGSTTSTTMNTVEEIDKRHEMKRCEKYRETDNARYALKHIKDKYLKESLEKGGSSHKYVQAARDLSLEAEIMAVLNHPNIIKLRGITHSGVEGFRNGPSGYFLIIDRLFDTLDSRIRSWRNGGGGGTSNGNSKRRRSIIMNSLSRRSDGRSILRSLRSFRMERRESEDPVGVVELNDEVMDERLSIALQISAALMYLHSHGIMYRDLKPANIGFDVRGDVKIFDFGLARVMPEDGRSHYHDQFDMSGAGSPRYMAPECLSGEPYNLKADVYSFAIVLWEILAGQIPYAFVRKRHQLTDFVIDEDGRPDIHESWPKDIKWMLESSFDADMDNRPDMESAYNSIRKTLASLRGGNIEELRSCFLNRRRSMQSMRCLTASDFKESVGSASRMDSDFINSVNRMLEDDSEEEEFFNSSEFQGRVHNNIDEAGEGQVKSR